MSYKWLNWYAKSYIGNSKEWLIYCKIWFRLKRDAGDWLSFKNKHSQLNYSSLGMDVMDIVQT